MEELSIHFTPNAGDPKQGTLTFESEVEGIAMTYANLYRRCLLQSVPSYSVCAIKCSYMNGAILEVCKSPFQVIPDLMGSLLEITNILHNAVFEVETEKEAFTLTTVLEGKVMLSDICTSPNTKIIDAENVKLLSEDKELATIVGERKITLELLFVKGIGYRIRDDNVATLKNYCGQTPDDWWIIMDSQHKGVLKVGYKEDKKLDKQIMTLDIVCNRGTVVDALTSCSNLIREVTEKVDKSLTENGDNGNV